MSWVYFLLSILSSFVSTIMVKMCRVLRWDLTVASNDAMRNNLFHHLKRLEVGAFKGLVSLRTRPSLNMSVWWRNGTADDTIWNVSHTHLRCSLRAHCPVTSSAFLTFIYQIPFSYWNREVNRPFAVYGNGESSSRLFFPLQNQHGNAGIGYLFRLIEANSRRMLGLHIFNGRS